MQLQSVQVVAFISDQPPVAAKAWLDIFGDIPANSQLISINHTAASETRDGFDLDLQCQAGRIDLTATGPEFQPAIITDGLPDNPDMVYIADLDAALSVMIPGALKAAKNNVVTRVALVIAYSQVAASPAETTKIVREMLGDVPAPAGATELDYRINVPVASRTEEAVGLNQIVRWATTARQFLRLGIGNGHTSTVPTFLALQSIDVNTVVGAPVTSDNAAALLNEVVERAKSFVGRSHDAVS